MSSDTGITKAILLAAGRGTRLGDITSDKPKPMVPVHGKPVIEHILIGMRAEGIREFLFIIGYKGSALREYFGDGTAWGVQVTYAEQDIGRNPGTGAALLLGRDFAADEAFLMSYGDILTDYAHYDATLMEYAESGCSAVLGVNWVEDPWAGGAVWMEGRRVSRVVEKPPKGEANTNWNLSGINIFSSEVFPILEKIPLSSRGEREITTAIEWLIETGRQVNAAEMRGYWSDIGTPEALAEAERRWPVSGE